MPLNNPVADVSQNILTPPTKVITVDLNGNYEGGGTSAFPSYVRIEDGVTSGNVVTVSQFHNADHQNPGTTAYGILTGGVAQLLTADGFIDRQKETGVDQVSNLGIVMGSQMFAQLFATTVPTTGTLTSGAASGTITPASMIGIQVGAVLTVDSAGTPENVVVTAVTSTTATVVPVNGAPSAPTFKATHTPSYTVTGFLFNQERDASGENSGASGKGTAVAAEYEETSGGPPLANGTPSLLRYDREVAALGKVAVNAGSGYACSSTTVGDTIITPTTPANFKTLTAGQWIRLSGSGTNEYVRVHDSYIVSTAPATIPLTSPVVNTGQTIATWDAFGANGPGTNPILLTGEGLEGVILNDQSQVGFGRMWQGDPNGNARVSIQAQGTPVTGSTTAAANTAFATTTLPAVASKTNYITGFSVTTQGGTGAAAGVVTITGIITGTLNYQVGCAANNNILLNVTFPSPIPASAVNTAIVVNVPTLGANTGAVAATIYGFVQ